MYTTLDPKQTDQLLLVRHGWFSPEYELTDNTFSYGKLSYSGLSRRRAVAISATNTWLFSYEQLFSRTILITDQTGAIIGRSTREMFNWRRTLVLETSFQADFYRPFLFSREYIWESKDYGTVLRMWNYPFNLRNKIKIEQTMIPATLILLLMFLGSHLTILRRRRRAAR
jgi:hypothetical protein